MAYTTAVKKIKKYPIGSRKLKTVTADHLEAFIDLMSYGGINPDGTTSKPMSQGYMLQFSAMLQGSFRFAVFPKADNLAAMRYVAAWQKENQIFSRTTRKSYYSYDYTWGIPEMADFLTGKKH